MANESFDQLICDLDTVISDSPVPEWANVLTRCSKSLINELKGYNDLLGRIVELESKKAVIDSVNESLVAENKRLAKDFSKLEARVDDNEQRNRNNCLLLHGVEENSNTNTDQLVYDVVKRELGISLTPSDITRSHRLGTPKPSRNTRSTKVNLRPIIFKFANFRMRQEVFYSKRKPKGKNISISESLTPSRYKLLREAQAKFGNGKVWTTEGRVSTKINDRIVTINSIDDLQSC